ncbi:GD16606 [Drosophila simulans]|uniref:GD16606 n=1 Tax=Drosophila simulans TaxID=7240 RepID=B4R3H9_DROSI|nr:GD16606 [Drosophila simulans]
MVTLRFLTPRRIVDYCRRLLSTDLVTALRPFYQAIRTDGQTHNPAEKRVNEESLRLLCSHLESLTGPSASGLPPDGHLEFYIPSGAEEAGGKGVSRLGQEMEKELGKVLRKGPVREKVRPPQAPVQTNTSALRELFKDAKREHSLEIWMRQALARSQASEVATLRGKIEGIEEALVQLLGIRGTRYDCGCNMERYHNCLSSLKGLSEDPKVAGQLGALRNRFVVFAPYTGISLEGDVMLFSGDSPAGWLAFLSEMRLHEEQLKLVPLYEKALSAVLLGIRIERRRVPEPGCEARAYAGSLRRVIRAVSEHLRLEESVQELPASLQDHQLAIVPDSDIPKVSQTGLFLAPASCSGPDLVEFICRNLDVASGRFSRYRRDIQVERQLWRQCQEELGLQRLSKVDSVTPDKMVVAIRHLLQSGVNRPCRALFCTSRMLFQVPTDGIVCIPWDFMSREK